MSIDEQKRKDAVRALINICVLESVLIVAVVAIYLATSNWQFLLGGVVGAQLIFIPMLLRWRNEHAASLKQAPGEGGK